jgi:tRNA pseudouridine55 synthase
VTEEALGEISGVLLIDKPSGPGSTAVLQHAKRLVGAKRAGHTGTLDPLASGLLVIATGEATKFSAGLLDADKAYRASVKLGVRTATGDSEGEVLARAEVRVSRDELLEILERFRGEIDQLPPRYAAIKHKGRPLYDYARRGEEAPRAPRRVFIHRLDLEEFAREAARIFVECSKGTYIRALAEDIGEALGCGAHLASLERTAVGPFALEQAIGLEALEALPMAERRARMLPPEALLRSWPKVVLDSRLAARFTHGQQVRAGGDEGDVAVFDDKGRFLGTASTGPGGALRPQRLLSTKPDEFKV